MIKVVSEKASEETNDAEKGEDNGKDVGAQMVAKEKERTRMTRLQ